MPAFPFPAFPANQQYADWLEGNGFKVEFGENEWGKFMFVSGSDSAVHIYEATLSAEEALNPNTVERIDLRLGVVSPWNPWSRTQQEAADE